MYMDVYIYRQREREGGPSLTIEALIELEVVTLTNDSQARKELDMPVHVAQAWFVDSPHRSSATIHMLALKCVRCCCGIVVAITLTAKRKGR